MRSTKSINRNSRDTGLLHNIYHYFRIISAYILQQFLMEVFNLRKCYSIGYNHQHCSDVTSKNKIE